MMFGHDISFAAFILVVFGISSSLSSSAAPSDPSRAVDFFEEKIRPVLADHCYKCHSAKAGKMKGGLALDSREALLRGGDTGQVISPGNATESLLLTAIRHSDPDLEMPPEEKLPDDTIANFEKWILWGAPFPEGGAGLAASFGHSGPSRPWWDDIAPDAWVSEELPIEHVVDHYVGARLNKSGIRPAGRADDASLFRRAALDLVGRIPAVEELTAFVQDGTSDKLRRAVDRWMETPAFVRHQATEFDWLLMDGNGGAFRDYLARAIGENRSWDQLFKEVVIAATKEENRGVEQFLKTRVRDLDRLVNDVSVRFFGVNISCAQCHDHPQVPSWKQDQYYGMKSFFSRTFENGEFIGEREYGQVSFKTTAGEEKRATLMFLTGGTIDEPVAAEPNGEEKKKERQRLEELKKNKQPVPAPSYSRRAQLVEAALKEGQDGYFARAIVNQLWNRLFGRGLVMPLDQMHGQNVPSHPELLAWLARDFARKNYDLRHLIRGLVLSETYARSSRWTGNARPDPALFAVAIPRPLTPQQMAASVQIAATNPEVFNRNQTENEREFERLETQGRDWAKLFDRTNGEFQLSADEALLFSNSETVRQELLSESNGRLMTRLLALRDRQAIIRTAIWNVLSRPPEPHELKVLDDYLARRSDRPAEAVRQLVWALLTSAEFRFNH